MILQTKILNAAYRDSVVLMRIASQIRQHEGILEAALFMGTPSNKDILKQSGFDHPNINNAGNNDIIIGVKAENSVYAEQGFESAINYLQSSGEQETGEADFKPLTIETALRRMGDANLLSISIPGPHVLREGRIALEKGLNLFIFSDNVPLEDEIELKNLALKNSALCMGPDCGTAYINGVGLGFYNATRKGRVGFIAASGTGLQAIVCRLFALGEGITHAIGVGGRDLSSAVGAKMTLFALNALAQDPDTKIIVIVSKPPAVDILPKLEQAFSEIKKPVVVCCLGAQPPTDSKALWVSYLSDAAEAAQCILQSKPWVPSSVESEELLGLYGLDQNQYDNCAVLGLYTGGTLAHEAHLILEKLVGEIDSNIGHRAPNSKHLILDLGDDQYTVGRPHPMIDPSTRTDVLREKFAAIHPKILFFDLVLGHGSTDDPATPLANAVTHLRLKGHDFVSFVSIVGTDLDPQNLDQQKAIIEKANIIILDSNVQVAKTVAYLVNGGKSIGKQTN